MKSIYTKKRVPSLLIFIYSLLLSPVITFSAIANSQAVKNSTQEISQVVIFPFVNLAGDYNGQKIITTLLEESMKKRGFNVVPYDEVNNFLVTKRIRNTSTLNSSTALEIKRDLKADAVLIGSIDFFTDNTPTDNTPSKGENYQGGSDQDVVAGLTLRLVSTIDCSILWTDTLSLAGSDFIHILGIGKINSAEHLVKKIVSQMTSEIPTKYWYDASSLNFYELGNVKINPQYSAGGKKIQISTNIVQLDEKPEKVTALVNGQKIDLINKRGSDYYYGEIEAPASDGTYGIDFSALGAAGDVTFEAAAELHVDNIPPKVDIKTNQDVTGGDNKRETVIFSLTPHDPIARWEVHILDIDNKTVRWGKGYGTLPSQVLWRGEDDYGRKNRDGSYKFQLSVWDEADNRAVYAKEIRLDSTPPAVKIEVDAFEGDEVVFRLNYDKNEKMDEWDFVVFYGETEIIKKLSGVGNVSNVIKIPLTLKNKESIEEDENIKISFTFKAKDVAGNIYETNGEKLVFASHKWKNFSQKSGGKEVFDF